MSCQAVRDKLTELNSILRGMRSVMVAFSGGVDSALLVHLAYSALGDKAIAVTVRTPAVSEEEIERAKRTCRMAGVEHILIEKDILSNEHIRSNPVDRCYHCKKEMFSAIFTLAGENGAGFVCEGSNSDDAAAHRPGRKALEEMGVRSPLSEVRLGKEEIRAISRERGLEVWNVASESCFLTRFPYGQEITPGDIERVRKAESSLRGLGLSGVRVRSYGDIARIEVRPEDIPLVSSEDKRSRLARDVKRSGFRYVTLDMEGYRAGSMDVDRGDRYAER